MAGEKECWPAHAMVGYARYEPHAKSEFLIRLQDRSSAASLAPCEAGEPAPLFAITITGQGKTLKTPAIPIGYRAVTRPYMINS